jgi:hypothetical protein
LQHLDQGGDGVEGLPFFPHCPDGVQDLEAGHEVLVIQKAEDGRQVLLLRLLLGDQSDVRPDDDGLVLVGTRGMAQGVNDGLVAVLVARDADGAEGHDRRQAHVGARIGVGTREGAVQGPGRVHVDFVVLGGLSGLSQGQGGCPADLEGALVLDPGDQFGDQRPRVRPEPAAHRDRVQSHDGLLFTQAQPQGAHDLALDAVIDPEVGEGEAGVDAQAGVPAVGQYVEQVRAGGLGGQLPPQLHRHHGRLGDAGVRVLDLLDPFLERLAVELLVHRQAVLQLEHGARLVRRSPHDQNKRQKKRSKQGGTHGHDSKKVCLPRLPPYHPAERRHKEESAGEGGNRQRDCRNARG